MGFEIDTSGCDRMLRDLAAFAGHGSNTEKALYVVTGKILDTAISYTPMSTQGELIERVNADVNLDFARYDAVGGDGVLTTNQGRRGPAGRQWLRETSTWTGRETNYLMKGGNPRRWSNARWARYQATAAQRESDLAQSLAIRTRKALASVGLTRQSWAQIADDLGISLNSPRLGQIRAAAASNGQQYKNGAGTREDTADGPVLVLKNSQPFLLRRDGAGILQRAVNTRLSAFEIEVRKGVEADFALFQKRYPGLDIRL